MRFLLFLLILSPFAKANEKISAQIERCGPLVGAGKYGVIITVAQTDDTKTSESYIVKGNAIKVCPALFEKVVLTGILSNGCKEDSVLKRFPNCTNKKILKLDM